MIISDNFRRLRNKKRETLQNHRYGKAYQNILGSFHLNADC